MAPRGSLLSLLLCFHSAAFVVVASPTRSLKDVRLCAISDQEEAKCESLKRDLQQQGLEPGLGCVRGQDKWDCMIKVEHEEADVVGGWSSDVYIGGKHHGLIPVLSEKHRSGLASQPRPDADEAEPWSYAYYAIAVVAKSDVSIRNVSDLRGRKSCHTGVNRHVGWLYPKSQLNRLGLLAEDDDDEGLSCTNPLAPVSAFFNASCVSNAHHAAFDPDRKYGSLCSLCSGQGDVKCTAADPYAGYTGAFKCLLDGTGDVAFVKDTTWAEVVKEKPEVASRKDDYELLCLDGSRKSLDDYKSCHWGRIPERALMTSPKADVNSIRSFFLEVQNANVSLFESKTFGGSSLLFGDNTEKFVSTGDDRNTYETYLEDYVGVREHQFACRVPPAKWCTISQQEQSKCLRMKDAFASKFIQPDLECVQGHDTEECVRLLRDGGASILSMDGGDIYEAGKKLGLKVLLNEDYGSEGGGSQAAKYWAVAVARKSSQGDVTFTNLRGKKSCHTGIGRTAGWQVPVGTLISAGQLEPTARCDIPGAVGRFFGESCAPGALSPKYNPTGTNPESLCSLCSGAGDSKCSRSDAEPFYGYSGAFRCLASGAGDVAFVKHVTVAENTEGRNPADWSRDLNETDFELLCKDGSRKPIGDYASCNLARVPAHAVVTSSLSPDSPNRERDLIQMMQMGQHYFSSKVSNGNFRLFSSATKDLLFTDSTVALKVVPRESRDYRKYLGDLAIAFDHLAPSQSLCDAILDSSPSTVA